MPAIIPIGVINAVKSIIQSFITFTILKELGASKANKEPIPKNKYKDPQEYLKDVTKVIIK